MPNIVDLDTNLINQIAARISGGTALPEDLALLGLGGQVLRKEADWQAIVAGLLTSAQTAADAGMASQVAPITAAHTPIGALSAAVTAQLSGMRRPQPCVMTGGWFDSGLRLDTATNVWVKKVINFRDEQAGKNYRLEVTAQQAASGGNITFFELDIATGIESQLWTEAMNSTTTGYDRGFLVVPLKKGDGAGPYPCVVNFNSSGTTTVKVWCWDGATKTSYTTTSFTGTSLYYVYDGVKQVFYISGNNTNTSLRVLYSDLERTTLTAPDYPNGVSFTGWTTDIFPNAMRGRMWYFGYSTFAIDSTDICRYSALRLQIPDRPGPGFNNAFQNALGVVSMYGATGTCSHYGATTGTFFHYASNTNLHQTAPGTTNNPYNNLNGADMYPGVVPIMVKRSNGTIEVEQIVYDFQYQVAARATQSLNWWVERMDWQLVRTTDWRPVCQGYTTPELWPRQASFTGTQLHTLVPQWIDPTWGRLAVARMAQYEAMGTSTYQLYYEKFAF